GAQRRRMTKSLRRLRALLAAGAALVAIAAIAAEKLSPDERRSGYEFMSPELRAMQDDDAANPGMLAVLDGEALWQRAEGAAGKSCAGCHGDAAAGMQGVAARYRAFDKTLGRAVDLEQHINMCRTARQEAPALPLESSELLALAAYVARQSKGQPLAVPDDPQTRPFIEAGRDIFR